MIKIAVISDMVWAERMQEDFSRWDGILLDRVPVTRVMVGFSRHTKRGFKSGIPISTDTFPKDDSTGKA